MSIALALEPLGIALAPDQLPERPRQESNLHPALRRRVLCPLSYEGGSESVAAYASVRGQVPGAFRTLHR